MSDLSGATATTPSSASPTDTSVPTDTSGPSCGTITNQVGLIGLRIGSVFIIMFTSCLGAFFPIISRRTKILNVPRALFDFAKYFGSGVIIATAFIHLLSPAITELTSPCLTGAWTQYPWPLALSMLSIFSIFLLELIAFRWGSAKLAALGVKVGHGHHAPQNFEPVVSEKEGSDVEQVALTKGEGETSDAIGQVIGIAILEFGIVLHSVLIGLTLAVSNRFKILFAVLVFHQMFEGLGLGSRLAYMPLPKRFSYVPLVGAMLYGLTTPIGIAAGLGVRVSYNPDSQKANIVSGILDSLSSGILLYTGLVELLAHEFLFNPNLDKISNARLAFSCICMVFGAGLMALLGNWA